MRAPAGLGVSLMLWVALTGCATLPSREPASRLMPDGQRWTLINMNAETPESYCYADDPAHCARYGRLYTWSAAQAVCRTLGGNWRLPSMDDFKELARPYGGLAGAGPEDGRPALRELLEGGKSGLDMLLGGGRDQRGYVRLEAHGFYWSTSEESATTARLLNFGKNSGKVYDQHGGDKTAAYAVRCVSPAGSGR